MASFLYEHKNMESWDASTSITLQSNCNLLEKS